MSIQSPPRPLSIAAGTMVSRVFMLVAIAIAGVPAFAAPTKVPAQATYYVRVTGSDANTGLTPESAFKTIQRAVTGCSRSSGGYTIYVGPGAYAEQVEVCVGAGSAAKPGKVGKPNRIIGDAAGKFTTDKPSPVIIDGGKSRAYGVYMQKGRYWTFSDLTFTGQTDTNIFWDDAENCDLSRCRIEAAPQYAFYAPESTDVVFENNTLIRSASSGHCVVITTQKERGIININGNRFAMTGPLYLSKGFETATASKALPSESPLGAGPYGIVVSDNNKTGRADLTITNNIGTDCTHGIYVYTQGPNSTAVVANNTIVGCRYPYVLAGLKTGPLALINNIASRCAYPSLAYTWINEKKSYQLNVTVVGLLQYKIQYPTIWTNFTSPAKLFTDKDPLFIKPDAGDFGLLAGSPARDAGIADDAPAYDIAGQARPADGNGDGVLAVDLGAWEGGVKARIKVISWWESSFDAGTDGYTPDRQRSARTLTDIGGATTTSTAKNNGNADKAVLKAAGANN